MGHGCSTVPPDSAESSPLAMVFTSNTERPTALARTAGVLTFAADTLGSKGSADQPTVTNLLGNYSETG